MTRQTDRQTERRTRGGRWAGERDRQTHSGRQTWQPESALAKTIYRLRLSCNLTAGDIIHVIVTFSSPGKGIVLTQKAGSNAVDVYLTGGNLIDYQYFFPVGSGACGKEEMELAQNSCVLVSCAFGQDLCGSTQMKLTAQ